MDTRTGEMVTMNFVKELIDKGSPSAKWYKEIPEDMLIEIEGMNRKQRRKWYRENKHRFTGDK